MGLDREQFYDPRVVAIVPMGFCYPGTGRAGDLPPRAECALAWLTANPWFEAEVVPRLRRRVRAVVRAAVGA